MGNAYPDDWAKSKRSKLRDCARGDVGEWSRRALAVCLPGVPLAAALGFAGNGDEYNTTGWRVGDEEERARAVAKGRFPFKSKRPDDTSVYGHIGSDDLHELGWYGVEGGHCPTPCATDPDCAWVRLADDDEVVKILGRKAVTGGDWYGAIADQCAVGIANIRRHMRQIRAKLDARIAWSDDRPVSLWMWSMACMSWSAGTGRAASHVNAYAAELAAVDESRRVGLFMELAGAVDDPGGRHRQDEYSALREAQKRAAARLAVEFTGEGPSALAWLDDGLGGDRGRVLARLVETTS